LDTTEQDEALSARDRRRLDLQDVSRRRVLDAAEEVFSRKGYHETTLREVAELAGYAVGSVYSFFESKDDLFSSIIMRRADEFMEGMRALDHRKSPALLLHDLVDAEIGYFRLHPGFARLVIGNASEAFNLPAAAEGPFAARHAETMALQAAIFERGQADGSLRGGDPAAMAVLLTGVLLAYASLDVKGVAPPLESLHDLVRDAFVVAAPTAQ
jgi:AcrR family transcriptional regulator